MQTQVLVTGATGFIGSRLASTLVDAGRSVRAMTRHPENYTGPGTAVGGDVSKPATLSAALDGIEVAYYLVHSLDSPDFRRLDAEAAHAFGSAAAAAGVRRIIYLGGLGDEGTELSAHLRSRREVEGILAAGGVPVTTLRAAVIVGDGGISWELTRQLVDHLPIMVAPRWVRTRTQPIAISDVIGYLADAMDAEETTGQAYDIGGPEILRYVDMLRRVARIQNRRTLPVLTVPLLTPGLSSRWLSLVTDVDTETARNLIDSMSNEVVVRDKRIQQILPRELTGFDDAVRVALGERSSTSEDPATDDSVAPEPDGKAQSR